MVFVSRHDGRMEHINSRTVSGANVSPRDFITAVACVPMLSQQISNEGAVDWTAIIVGMASGTLKVYTENGVLVFTQNLLSDQSIKSIKCSSFFSEALCGKSNSAKDKDKLDEILVFFQKSVALIEGFAFYQTIRSARNHVAKLRPGTEVDLNVSLSYTIYNLKSSSAKFHDCFSCGLSNSSLLDHLIFASYDGMEGPNITGKSKSTFTSLVTIGEEPFLGLYHASDSSNGSLIDTVASAVMTKAMTFIPFASSGPAPPTPIIVSERLGIYDQPRGACSAALSPDRKFLAVADTLARVTIIDIEAMLVLRIWKGYRNAQCAWLLVNENSADPSSKKSLCLIIYAPKRGILEIWKAVNGPRIAVFPVSKEASIFNFTHSIFGLNSISIEKFPSYMSYVPYMFDFVTGKLFTFNVPFVCTLTDPNSKVVRDGHFIRELSELFKVDPLDSSKVQTVLSQIETIDAKKQALQLACEKLETVRKVVEIFLNRSKEQVENSSESVKYEDKLLFQNCLRLQQLSELYLKLASISQCECEILDFHQHPDLPEIDSLAGTMSWAATDAVKCLSLFSLRHSVIPPAAVAKMTLDRNIPSFKDFVSIFQIDRQQVAKSSDGNLITSAVEVCIDWSNLKDSDCVASVGSFFLQPLMDLSANPIEIIHWFNESSIKGTHLLRIIFESWLNDTNYINHWKNWQRFSLVISTITDQCGDEWNDEQNDTVLPLTWKIICSKIIASTNLPASLIGVVIAKTIAEERTQILKKSHAIKGTAQASGESFDADAEWEALHLDKEKLNLLFKQIEDVFLLELLLKCDKGKVSQSSNLSLEFLIKSDPGIISELVAKWIVQLNLDPVLLLSNYEELGQEPSEKTGEAGGEKSSLDYDSIKELLGHLQRCFPYSLDPQVIIANCCWESLCLWDKNPSTVESELLKKALTFLSQITSATLVHNLSCLIWKTFILRKFESLAQLCEKMAKIPKDRICRKELNMGDECIEYVVSFACDLLELILDNIKHAESESAPVFPLDEWWKNCSKEHMSSRTPLIILASTVKSSNSLAVLATWHLAQILLLMATFSMKNVKPLSLFMPSVRKLFFKELSHTTTEEMLICDFDLVQARTEFLHKCSHFIAQSIPPKSEVCNREDLLVSPTKIHSNANKWLNKLLVLAREWELNVDSIRRLFVCELYSNDCDSFAEEIVSSISDKVAFATEVLPIACQRVKLLVEANQITSSLHPTVKQWIDSYECRFKVQMASKESTIKLLSQFILANLPDSSPSQKLASLLFENLSCVL